MSDWQNNNSSNSVLLIIILFLQLIILAWIGYLAFKITVLDFVKDIAKWWTVQNNLVTPNTVAEDNTPLTVTIISDQRCGDQCDTSTLLTQLKEIPKINGSGIVELDYSDEKAKAMLESSWIKNLPAAIFSTKNVGNADLEKFLSENSDTTYSLALGSTYDPTIERSDRGFTVAPKATQETALKDAHYKWSENAKIVWIEYTDLNCHYCKKMEKDGTAKTILEKYPNDVKKASSNFIGVWWTKTQEGAEALECIAKVWWSDAYNKAISNALLTEKTDKSDIIAYTKEIWVDTAKVQSCFDAGDTKTIVDAKFDAGKDLFGITGTPGNVLINTETWEYEVVSGAHPVATFEGVIDRMLK